MAIDKSLYTNKPKDVTSLDDDLHSSRQLKYEKLALIVKPWIFDILNESVPSTDLIELLHDGTILCKLVNQIEKDNNQSGHLIKFKESSIAFMQMENISFFLRYCKIIGVPEDELFLTADLFDVKDPYQVMLTIQSFSRSLNKKYPNVKIIGPKVFDKPAVPRKPKNLQNYVYSMKNPNWSTMEYGYMAGANQNTEGQVFSGPRKI